MEELLKNAVLHYWGGYEANLVLPAQSGAYLDTYMVGLEFPSKELADAFIAAIQGRQ